MTSYQPGTRVFARPSPVKDAWRVAKVVERPTQGSDVVKLKFVGRTDIVEVSSQDVRRASERPTPLPGIDLTVSYNSTQNNEHLPRYSDPWDPDSDKPKPQPIPPPQPPPPPSILSKHDPKQSSRLWLLGRPAQRQTQVANDPSSQPQSFRFTAVRSEEPVRPSSMPTLPVPRHPHYAVDDDVRIPRNLGSRRSVETVAVSNARDLCGNIRSYHAPKRQRLRYNMLTLDQLPPSAEQEGHVRELSWRLAKRKRSRQVIPDGDVRDNSVVSSLPYQRPVEKQDEGTDTRIAPDFVSFDGVNKLSVLVVAEKSVLDRIFSDISFRASRIIRNHYGEVLDGADRSLPPLIVRSGGRKKSRPKRLQRLHGYHELGHRVHLVPDLCQLAPHCISDEENCAVPRVYGCSCACSAPHHQRLKDGMHMRDQLSRLVEREDQGSNLSWRLVKREKRRQPLLDGSVREYFVSHRTASDITLQCCVCTLWSHLSCTRLEKEQIEALRKGTMSRYVCVHCLDEQFARVTVYTRPLPHMFDERTTWISSVHGVLELKSGFRIHATDTMLHSSLSNDRCEKTSIWNRRPLSEKDISAREANLERLRSGITDMSVGERERALFDGIHFSSLTKI